MLLLKRIKQQIFFRNPFQKKANFQNTKENHAQLFEFKQIKDSLFEFQPKMQSFKNQYCIPKLRKYYYTNLNHGKHFIGK